MPDIDASNAAHNAHQHSQHSSVHNQALPKASPILFKDLGIMPYEDCWAAMRDFTDHRQAAARDELWLVEHPAVFTQGQAGKSEHILAHSDVPIIQTDRGGQVTYHGPGQLVAYPLLNLKRKNLGVRQLVTLLEQSVIDCLASLDIESFAKSDAPGVYVQGQKIASLGLRVRKGCSYHGVSLNVAMDLSPFNAINPCGYAGLEMTQVKEHVTFDGSLFDHVKTLYVASLLNALNCHAEYE